MDKALLIYHMNRHNETQQALANALHMAQSALSKRMNGEIDFRKNEMEAIQKRYSLSADDMQAIFFAS